MKENKSKKINKANIHKTVDKAKKNKNSVDSKLSKIISRRNVVYLLILVADLSIIIYAARRNIINYVEVSKNKYSYFGDSSNIYFGRNYITLVTTLVVYIYLLILNKFYYKIKIDIKYLVLSFIILFFINIIMFYLFTIKVY